MKHSVLTLTAAIKRQLYRKYVKGAYAKHNKERIDWVLKNVYKKLIKVYNKNEEKVLSQLSNHNVYAESQVPIPILSSGGKLEHLYIADIVVGNTIIEVDGPLHEDQKEWDEERDLLTSEEGYTTIRIPTSDLSSDTIDNYLQNVYDTNQQNVWFPSWK